MGIGDRQPATVVAELPEERSLSGIQVLSVIPQEALRDVERLCQWESYRPGAWLFERGQETNHVFFVIKGVIRVLNYSATGRVVRFASVGPGGVFGELAAIDSLPRSATVVADLSPSLRPRISTA